MKRINNKLNTLFSVILTAIFFFTSCNSVVTSSTSGNDKTLEYNIQHNTIVRPCPAGLKIVGGVCQAIVKPASGSSGGTSDPGCGETINPNALNFNGKSLGFSTKSFSSENISQSISELIQKVNEINVLAAKSQSLQERITAKTNSTPPQDASAETAKKIEVDSQKTIAENQRDILKNEIISGLTSYKDRLRAKVNTLMNDPNYSVDDTSKPADLQGYKDSIDELGDNLFSYVTSKNTYGLIYAMSNLADENKVLIDLINDYVSNALPGLLPVTNTGNLTELDMLTKPDQITLYLSKQIDYHKMRIDSENQKLKEEVNKLDADIAAYQKIENDVNNFLSNLPPELLQEIQSGNNFYAQSTAETDNNFSVQGAADPACLVPGNGGGALGGSPQALADVLAALFGIWSELEPGETATPCAKNVAKKVDTVGKQVTREKEKTQEKKNKKCKADPGTRRPDGDLFKNKKHGLLWTDADAFSRAKRDNKEQGRFGTLEEINYMVEMSRGICPNPDGIEIPLPPGHKCKVFSPDGITVYEGKDVTKIWFKVLPDGKVHGYPKR